MVGAPTPPGVGVSDDEERFRLLVSAVSDYAIFLLDPDGIVVSWNPGAEQLKGYGPDEIVGRHFSVFYGEEDLTTGLPGDALRCAADEGRWEHEGWRVRADGSRFWASVVITALRGPDGTLLGFAKITRDFTERKRTEDALRRIIERERAAAEQLRELDRLKTDLVAIVAHDLRGPVLLIQNLVEVLQDDWATPDDERRSEVLARLAGRAASLGALVDDIVDMATIEAGHLAIVPGPMDVGELVHRVVADAVAASPAREIRAEVTEPTAAYGDVHRTWQILTNLVSNAVKFGPPDEPVVVRASTVGDEVVVAVVDRGPGIDPADRDRVFERFGRLRGSAGTPGAGLGLYIARSLAEAQGGRLVLDSEPGQGSTFSFSVPVGTAG